MALWPYVNGKALSNGLRLRDMDMDEMFDVIHFYFEEDNKHTSAESMEAQSDLRIAVYKMYDKDYPFKYKSKQQPKSPADYGYEVENSPYDTSVADKPFDPKTEPTKAYTPATEFDAEASNPFGSILDAPAGG